MRAVNITENILGKNLGDKSFWPVWDAIEAANLPIFLHNVDPISERLVEKDYTMINVLGNPFEATIAATALVLGGVMDAFPKLDVYLPHAGGFFAFVTPRTDWSMGTAEYAPRGRTNSFKNLKQPRASDYRRRFHYDLIMHDPKFTRMPDRHGGRGPRRVRHRLSAGHGHHEAGGLRRGDTRGSRRKRRKRSSATTRRGCSGCDECRMRRPMRRETQSKLIARRPGSAAAPDIPSKCDSVVSWSVTVGFMRRQWGWCSGFLIGPLGPWCEPRCCSPAIERPRRRGSSPFALAACLTQSGTMSTNQVVLIKGDRITDVGPAVQIPAGASVIDLSGATVLPGMIDTHLHLMPQNDWSLPYKTMVGLQHAQQDLNGGFTTIVDLSARGTWATIDIRNAINRGVAKGPRMQVAGPQIDPSNRSMAPAPGGVDTSAMADDLFTLGPWAARAAVRKLSQYGADWVKIYATQDFEGDEYQHFKPDGTMVNSPSLTLEEMQAIVDEATAGA